MVFFGFFFEKISKRLIVIKMVALASRSPRIIGMGSGLFAFMLIGFITLIIILVGRCQKTSSQRLLISVVVPLVIFVLPLSLVLISPRADPYNTIKLTMEYDLTYRPRIAIGVIQSLFVMVAIASFLATHGFQPVNSKRIEDDVENFDPKIHVYK